MFMFTDMEDGNRFIEILTYGVIAFVVLAMIALLIRTLTLVIGFLSLTLADALHRWRPTPAEESRAEEGKSPPVPE